MVFGQTTNYYTTNGAEYAIVGSLPGDQVFPDVAVTTGDGFIVWQDNITDGDGWGISAMQLNSTLSSTLGVFRVNQQGAGDQQNPRVALLQGGGAVFVWQGGPKESQHIYSRFLSSSNTFLTTNDVLVNTLITNVLYNYTTGYITNITAIITTNHLGMNKTYTTNYATNAIPTITTNTSGSVVNSQINPAVAVLNNSNVVVVWASFGETGPNSLQGVYGQILSPTGQKIGGEFLVNQSTPYNQRTPTVAALSNGGFVVAWVSESGVAAPSSSLQTPGQMHYPSVDIYARLYNGSGVALTNGFLVNSDSNPCANPDVAAGSDGGFMVTWDARDMTSLFGNSLDIYARPFSSAGVGGTNVCVNYSYRYGDQYAPRISALGTDYLIVWTSLAQDGSREGVYGQFLSGAGSKVGSEFRVNTTTVNSQIQPVVASDGVGQFLAIWSSFTGTSYGFDLFAQRYVNTAAVLQPMPIPFVYAPFVVSNGVYQPQLVVSWSVTGLSISNYEVYVDGAGTPMALTTNTTWTMTAAENGLAANSTHSFQLDYVMTDGRRSPISPSASGTTWLGYYWGTPTNAIPDEWMAMYFGAQSSSWPLATDDSDGDGMNNYQEFLAGTNPTNSASVLRVQISNSPPGQQSGHVSSQNLQEMYLSWNTQPGLTYQVQMTMNFTTTTWSDFGTPRLARGYTDQISVGKDSGGYYRIVLLRQ